MQDEKWWRVGKPAYPARAGFVPAAQPPTRRRVNGAMVGAGPGRLNGPEALFTEVPGF